ncbi:protein-disulfide isomerase [Mycobacterium frederiksbergense]|uniref:Protein-disulfide isomerase n=1 Tax=Mycolicibacterium frederiksbergense TaxID=117567 RepID=A0ABT6L8J4_9MYCO|nr:thioredoxin domain-containing protein [Mycolicibacterium frederiksbergense]MDH6198685.1 protein-disulfide isomerase [Mycolicibacterium frederiksbergense]
MRLSRVAAAVLAVLALSAVGSTTGCTRLVDGTAHPNLNMPGSEITEDGAGIQIGYPDAPVQIEFYTEPQCPACAQLQHDFGDQLALAIGSGQLAVTYRPLTFLDHLGTDYSARVANAMFLAAGPGTTGAAFQAFVQDLWGHQQAEGSRGPTDDELASMADDSGVDPDQIVSIVAGEEFIDSEELNQVNAELLIDTAYDVSTPTIYDLVNDDLVDTSDPEWLAKLLATPTS